MRTFFILQFYDSAKFEMIPERPLFKVKACLQFVPLLLLNITTITENYEKNKQE